MGTVNFLYVASQFYVLCALKSQVFFIHVFIALSARDRPLCASTLEPKTEAKTTLGSFSVLQTHPWLRDYIQINWSVSSWYSVN